VEICPRSVRMGVPHMLDALSTGECAYCAPLVNWQAGMFSRLLEVESDGSPVEVVVPVVEVEDGDTARAHQQPHDDEHDAEHPGAADDHDDPRDHERHGDEP
jgi:hypothetical protein